MDPAYNYYVANYGVNVIFYTCEYENLNENLMSDDLYNNKVCGGHYLGIMFSFKNEALPM